MRGWMAVAGLALLALAAPGAALDLDRHIVTAKGRDLPAALGGLGWPEPEPELGPVDVPIGAPLETPAPPVPVDEMVPEPAAPVWYQAEARLAPLAPAALREAEVATAGATDPRTSEEEAPHAPTKGFGRAGIAPEAPDAVGSTAAVVGGLALVAGLAAWCWPALKLALAPLYSRISKDAVLAHGSRENIYRLVQEHPGIHAHEVAERLDLAWGTAIHHLKLLEQAGLLTAYRDGRYKRFFVVGDPRIQRKEAVALLRNDTARRIAEAVSQRPGLIQKDVCQALGVSSSLATWHLQRLAEAGLVLAQRRGRVVHYEPGPAWRALRDVPPV